jgi:hypothetical protein
MSDNGHDDFPPDYDDDEIAYYLAQQAEEEAAKPEPMTDEEYRKFVLDTMFQGYSSPAPEKTATVPVVPSVLDVVQASGISRNNRTARVSRELTHVESAIRDAAYDQEVSCSFMNLAPETVRELRYRGFTVTERKTEFIDDPMMYYRSEATPFSTRYIVSWDLTGRMLQ